MKFVSNPNINKNDNHINHHQNRTYQTTIAERDKDQLTKKAIRQAITNIVKFELGIKGNVVAGNSSKRNVF